MKKCFLSAVAFGSVLALATPALALAPLGGFTGIFAVTPDAGPAGVSRAVGNWTATITGDGLVSPVGTTSVNIQAFPPEFQDALGQTTFIPPPQSSTATLAMNAPFSGLFSFDYSSEGLGLTFFSTSGGSQQLVNSGTLIKNLTVGEHFGFRAVSENFDNFLSAGRSGGSLAAPGSQFLSISNPQAVPEASSLSGLALVGLMAWGISLKRRQA